MQAPSLSLGGSETFWKIIYKIELFHTGNKWNEFLFNKMYFIFNPDNAKFFCQCYINVLYIYKYDQDATQRSILSGAQLV